MWPDDATQRKRGNKSLLKKCAKSRVYEPRAHVPNWLASDALTRAVIPLVHGPGTGSCAAMRGRSCAP